MNSENCNLMVAIPRWYLEWCWENEELQKYWLEVVELEDGKLLSNIHPGDRFTHGKRNQVSVIANRTNILCLDMSDEFEFTISHNIGGCWYTQKQLPKSKQPAHYFFKYVYWIPAAEQLAVLGFEKVAMRLLTDVPKLKFRCRGCRERRDGHDGQSASAVGVCDVCGQAPRILWRYPLV